MTIKWHDVNERSRVYAFPDGSSVKIENVTRLGISDTTHRVETDKGEKFIVPNGWRMIQLDMDEWSV